MADEVTTGEVLRLVQLTREEHGELLSEIRAKVTLTNGTVGRHEERLIGHDRELRDLKATAALRARSSGGSRHSDVIAIPITAKTVTALITILGGLIAAAIAAYFKG